MREMFDDDAARRVLQALADDPEPPVETTFDQVLRRGRRRVFMQRAGAVAGVVAVVAAIGVGALILRPGDSSGNGVRVADSPTAPTSTSAGPESTRTTESTPLAPTAVLPGWAVVAPIEGLECTVAVIGPGEPDIVLRPEETVKDVFVEAIADVRQLPPLTATSEWQITSAKNYGPRGYVTVKVPMDNGSGQLQLETGRFGGTPEEAANLDIFGYGQCELPQRRVLADGTVLQLYTAESGEQPTQFLNVYEPDGRFYNITSAGYSEDDAVLVGESKTYVGGRGKLPTTQEQLADIAERFVTNLY
ncbi:hypothetical protein [Actinophytocola sp.]|uniref:hypothetical protein n=1 Tax=Actinophytocola sp. TaxID=1872138 RepID=UPI002ED685BE